MAWDKGFNFRTTPSYVTDGPDETYVAEDIYPVTRNGVTFGWSSTISDRDRDSTVDRRLAGLTQRTNDGNTETFRVDLEAADTYDITLALGDTGFLQGYQYCNFQDDTTVFQTIDDTNGTAVDNYDDATGVNRTEANWPTQNVKYTRIFTSAIFRCRIGSPVSQANSSTIAHLFLSRISAEEELNTAMLTGVGR